MNTITSWAGLRAAINKLKPEDADGFEGLVTALFAAETGERFFAARRGDQPVGDAYSATSGTALQAKRYRTAEISANNVDGEISRALREAPTLDLFVVAATRADAQLRARLVHKAQETGLDIVLLELSDALSDFGALCVTHWQIARTFLRGINQAADAWAATVAGERATLDAIQQLRGELRGRVTRGLVSNLASERFSSRFNPGPNGGHTHNRVDLARVIHRPALRQDLARWWSDSTVNVPAVLRGEEGTGKTWVAAAFAADILAGDGTALPVALWADSLVWGQARTLEALVGTMVRELLPPMDVRAERLQRKFFSRWSEPVLLVLDGANERDAWTAAEHLLADHGRQTDELRSRLRLLFTSRPAENHPGVPRRLWAGCTTVQVGSFDDAEFRVALDRFAPGVAPEDFTARVSHYARIPRYFQLCVGLRERLNSLHHLSKPLLLWADLQDKIERGDPQLLAIEAKTDQRAEEVIAGLARGVGWPENGRATATTAELERQLPNFRGVRAELADQRIVLEPSLNELTLNADHVVLGWALILQRLAVVHAHEGFDVLSNRLERMLEPAAANDDKVRAVHLAALLTFLADEERPSGHPADSPRQDRSALLAWWATHHNAVASVADLAFFVQRDLTAYASAVESLFRQHLPGNLDTALVAPLAVAWRDDAEILEPMRAVLERWMRLIYPGDASGSKGRDVEPPSRLRPAKTREQLRLSYAAASIISMEPRSELLPALADCYYSLRFCYEDHPVQNGEPVRLPIKSPMEPLGTLMRWRFTESALASLQRLGESLPADSDELDSLHWFARLLRQTSLPTVLGVAEDYIGWEKRPPAPRRQLEAFRSFLRVPDPERHEPIGFGQLGPLAVRRDLPELDVAEVFALREDARSRLVRLGSGSSSNTTGKTAQWDDLLPWLARHAPNDFGASVRTLWGDAMQSPEPLESLFQLDELLPAEDPDGRLAAELLDHAADLLTRERAEMVLVPLTELMLLHGTLETVLAWLRAIQDVAIERGGGAAIGLLPLPTAFRGLAPRGLAEAARQEFEASRPEMDQTADDQERRRRCVRARHWLQIYAYVVEATPEVVSWALQLADELAAEEEFRFALFLIVSRSEDPTLFERALLHPTFQEYQTGFNSWRWTPDIPKGTRPDFTFDALHGKTSMTVSGRLLRARGQDEELCRWGRALAVQAMTAFGNVPPQTEVSATKLTVNVGPGGDHQGFGVQPLPHGGETWRGTDGPAWGVDRSEERAAPTQEDADRQMAQFHADLKLWREPSRREFMEFNAVSPLLRWSELEPERFVAFAEEFLGRVWHEGTGEVMEFAFFAAALGVGLLRIVPASARRFAEHTSGGIRVRVLTFDGALSWGTHQLWDAGLNHHPEIRRLRAEMLETVASDEAILWQVLAAHAGGNEGEITALADARLAKPSARERALGVSLLAFQGNADANARLQNLLATDPSFWVREHAQWAQEVCLAELACRERYRTALGAGTLDEAALALAEIRAAASPMAYAWRGQIERSVAWTPDKRTRAYFDLFWYHWGNTSTRKRDIRLGGRELPKYCRGDRMDEGVSSRQAPWWRP